MSRFTRYSLTAAVLVCAALLFLGSQDLPASKTTDDRPLLTQEDIDRLAAEAPVCEDGAADQSVEGTEMAPGGGPCKDCPRNIGSKCTRLSCDPCCCACVGEPLPVCSS